MKQLLCPISNEKVNEQTVRLSAFLSILLLIAAFWLNTYFLLILLAVDFFIRAFSRAMVSPLSLLAHWLNQSLKLGERKIDKAPKIFAARLGFIATSVILILQISGQQVAALIAGGIFMLLALLEAALALCLGCAIYTYLVLPFYKSFR